MNTSTDRAKRFIGANYSSIAGILINIICFAVFYFKNSLSSDEPSFLYNAESIAKNFTDSFGDKFPIYFNTWIIGGHSPLPIYIAALFVKLFGSNYFALRLSSLFLSCITIFIFFKLCKLLFHSDKNIHIITLIYACCWPTILYSSSLFWDQSFMNYFLCIGLYCLVYGISSKKKLFILLSSVFFSLTFYCYGLSVFITPILVSVIYIWFLVKKVLKIQDAIINFCIVLLVSFPFILFGLKTLGLIDIESFLGITYPDMSQYARTCFIDFGLKTFFNNILFYLCALCPLTGQNNYAAVAYILVLIFLIIKIFYIKLAKIHIDKTEFFLPVLVASLLSIFVYSLFVLNAVGIDYRVSAFSVLLILCLSPILITMTQNTKKSGQCILIIIYCLVSILYAKPWNSNIDTFKSINSDNIQKIDIYYDTDIVTDEDVQNDQVKYDEAIISYMVRLNYSENKFISFKDEQLSRYSDEKTIIVSEENTYTENESDINADHYLLTCSTKSFPNRKLVKTFENFNVTLTIFNGEWYLYSPETQ